jgi:hypothetical protein
MQILAIPRPRTYLDSLRAKDFVKPCQRHLPLVRLTHHPLQIIPNHLVHGCIPVDRHFPRRAQQIVV